MSILLTLCLLSSPIHCYTPIDFIKVLSCSSSAFSDHVKYFLMKKDHCYIPQASSSKTTEMVTPNIYTGVSGEMILFRLLSGSGVKSFDYFINSNENSNETVEDDNEEQFKNFRSILLDEWDNIRPSLINITIMDYDDNIAAGFLFKVMATDSYTTWFSEENLMNSFPWNISYLRSYGYNFFSIRGDSSNKRSFYINLFNKFCVTDKGLFGIMEDVNHCPYGNKWNKSLFKFPQILCVNDNNRAGLWSTNAIPMKYLEITAIYDENFTFYI